MVYGARFGLHCGCIKIFDPSSSDIFQVGKDVCGLPLP